MPDASHLAVSLAATLSFLLVSGKPHISILVGLILFANVGAFALQPHLWQMWPAWSCMLLAGSTFLLGMPLPSAIAVSIALGGAALSFLLSLIAPHISFPLPDGPHRVGRRTVELVDTSRRAWLVEETGGPRRLPVDIYYPCVAPRTRDARQPYFLGADLLRAVCTEFKLPTWMFMHVAAVQLPATEDAEPLPQTDGRGCPLVLFSHSLTGLRSQNTGLMLHLASHGIVCATLEHPYEAILTRFADGSLAPFLFYKALPKGLTAASLLRFRQRCVQYRSDDLAFLHRCLAAASAGRTNDDKDTPSGTAVEGETTADRPRRAQRSPARQRRTAAATNSSVNDDADLGFLRGLLRPDAKAVVIGHSCGGGGAVLYAQQHPERCAGCVSLDGYLWWLGAAKVHAGLAVPLLSLRSETFMNDKDEFLCCNTQLASQLAMCSTAAVTSVVLSNVGHFDYSDMPYLRVTPYLLRKAGIQEVSDSGGVQLHGWLHRLIAAFVSDPSADASVLRRIASPNEATELPAPINEEWEDFARLQRVVKTGSITQRARALSQPWTTAQLRLLAEQCERARSGEDKRAYLYSLPAPPPEEARRNGRGKVHEKASSSLASELHCLFLSHTEIEVQDRMRVCLQALRAPPPLR